MKRLIISILATLLFCYSKAYGQEDSLLQKQINGYLDFSIDEISDEENTISEEFLEQLSELEKDSFNLNALPYDIAIHTLHFTDYQYYQLQLYIENYGQLASIYELHAVDGFSKEFITKLKPFLYVAFIQENQPFFKNLFSKAKQTLWVRYGRIMEPQVGYDTTQRKHYEGKPGHACFRYTFTSQDKFTIKFAGEKDPGEQFFKGAQRKGFDFYGGSLNIKNVGILKDLIIGDFRVNFGQGVVMGSTLLSGKGGNPSTLRRFSTGVRAIASTNENDFLRGSAVSLGKTKLSGTFFWGREYGSLTNSVGLNINYNHPQFKIGFRLLSNSYTDTLSNKLSRKLLSSIIPQNLTLSTDYQTTLKRALLYGEIAITEKGKTGMVHAILLNITPTLKSAILFRHYNKDFHASLGGAFGTNSTNSGETGLYITSSWIINKQLTLQSFVDYYRLTWTSYRTHAPITGKDIGGTLFCQIRRNSLLSLRYSFREKAKDSAEQTYYKQLQNHNKHKLTLTWNNEFFTTFKTKTGFQLHLNTIDASTHGKKGVLIYQDIALNFRKYDLSLRARIAYFDTDSYDERLSVYEDDVYYAFTIGSYYYQGIRGYVVLRYKWKWLAVWFRLAHSYYTNQTSISSGLNLINKPHKTDLTLQLLFQI